MVTARLRVGSMGCARPLTGLLALGLAFAPGAARAERLPIQADMDICALRASEHGDTSLGGSVRLQILTRANGKVYAAFTHSAKGIRDKVFEYCLASNALLWQYPPVGLDTSAPFPISVIPGGSTTGQDHGSQTPPQVFLPSAHPEVEPTELDVPRAQETLNVLEDATLAERGLAALAVQEYPEAVGHLRAALEKDPNDRMALRGLAQALAEQGTNPAEARAAALKLALLAPDSEVSAEAMLRVCAAEKDDGCVFDAWRRARAMPDVAPRSRILQEELKPVVERSAMRLRAASLEKASQAAAEGFAPAPKPAAPQDPCALEATPAAQALCEVKRCLDAGSAEYARGLTQARADGAVFTAGEWRSKEAGKDRLLVTRPIATGEKPGAPAEHRDAIFLVKIGEQFSIQPSSADARAIARDHNGCAAPPAPAAAAPK